MMHHLLRAGVALCAAALVTGSALGTEPWDNAIPLDQESCFLTVGNSLTGLKQGGVAGYMDLAMQKDLGYGIEWGRLSKWGKGLDTHYQADSYPESDAGGLVDPSKRAFETILDGPTDGADRWDVVAVQGYSMDTDQDPTAFHNYVRKFDQVIRKQGGQTTLFARYGGYHDSFSQFETLQNRIDSNYQSIGRELGAPVVPSSKVFLEATRVSQRPDDAGEYWLYADDHGHPSDYGKLAYMYAFYSMLTHRSPVGLDLGDQIIPVSDPAKDEFLQQTAWQVVKDQVAWDEPGYTGPARNGEVTAEYDAETGEVTLTVTGDVTGIRLGSPATQLMQAFAASAIDGEAAVQADSEILAWHDEQGFAEGTYELGQIVTPGTDYDESLLFAYTPGEGGVGEMALIPEPASLAMLGLSGLLLVRRRRTHA
ncbi:MAG: PEP-CTERM sorting domain-containing protein [Phycisphaeraceae bacterium]